MYTLCHSVVSKTYKKYKSSLLPSLKMSLICSHLLSSFSLVTLEKIIKKVYTVINKIYNLDLKIFSRRDLARVRKIF